MNSNKLVHFFRTPTSAAIQKMYEYAPLFILIIITIYNQWDRTAAHAIITWDVFGYYVYLPGLFIYQDIETFSFVNALHETYVFSQNVYQINGDQMPIYTIGQAILILPFFLLGHVWASLSTMYPADGLSLPYQWTYVMGTLTWVSLGYVAIKAWLKQFLPKQWVHIALFTLLFGTNLYAYTILESGMPHAFLWGLYGVFLWGLHLWYQKPNTLLSIFLGLAMGLLCLARPSEIVLIFLFLCYPSLQIQGISSRLAWWKKHGFFILLIVLMGLVSLMPQIAFWYWRMGTVLYNAYAEGGHHFDFTKPHIWDGLFSMRKGWLVYTPLMGFALWGLIYMWLQKIPGRLMLSLFFISNLYFVLSWHMWWYAGSFGMRALVQSYAPLSLALGYGLYSFNRHVALKYAAGLFILFGIGLNMFQTWQYQKRILPPDEINAMYYKAIWGKTQVDKQLYKYLTHPEKAPNYLKNFQAIASILPTDERSILLDDQWAQKITAEQPFSMTIRIDSLPAKHRGWIRVEAAIKYLGDDFNEYNAATLVAHLLSLEDENVKWTAVPFQRCFDPEKKELFYFDFNIPNDARQDDYLLVYVYNNSPDTVYLYQLTVYQAEH